MPQATQGYPITMPARMPGNLVAATSLGLLLSLTGCASRQVAEQLPFSDSLIQDYGLSEPHKQRLQYYVSRPITLARGSASAQRGIAGGRLVDRGQRQVRKLQVPANTPGVVVGSGNHWLAVSFEAGSYLYFVSDQPALESPYRSESREPGRYYLYAPDWDGRSGTVKVGDISYQALDQSMDAYLLVDRESLYETDSEGRVLSGRLLERD